MDKNKIFLKNRGELEGRFDPLYYLLSAGKSFKETKLKEYLLDVFQGQVQGKREKDNIKVLKVKNLNLSGDIDFEDVTYISDVPNRKILQKNDIITPFRGQTIYTRKFAYFDSTERATIDNNLGVIRLNSKLILPKFFYYYISSELGFQEILKNIVGAGIPALTKHIISEIKIPVLSQTIQQKIIDIMDNAYKLKNQKEDEAKNILDSIDEYLLEQLGISLPKEEENTLQNRTFQVEFSDVFNNRFDAQFYLKSYQDNLENIRSKNFKTLKSIVSFSSETWNQKDIFEEEFPYIEISEIDLAYGKIKKVNYVKLKDAPSRAKMIVRNDDIIISTTRPTRGAIALVKTDDILIASTGFSVIRHIYGDVDRKYLFRVLRSKMVLMQLGQRSTGGNYPAIAQAELEKILIPFPEDIDKQQHIADQIKLMEENAEKLFGDASKIYKDAIKEVEKIILGDSYES